MYSVLKQEDLGALFPVLINELILPSLACRHKKQIVKTFPYKMVLQQLISSCLFNI